MNDDIEYKGYIIKVKQDEDAYDPREDAGEQAMGIMNCMHGRYNLGDKHDHKSDDFNGWDGFEKHLVEEHDAAIILPLYLYDHSGITMSVSSFSCQWDSGQVGFIYTTNERIKNLYAIKRVTKAKLKQAEKELIGEVDVYDKYIKGEVYISIIENKDGEMLDTYGGCYDYNEAEREAKCNIDGIVEDNRKRKQKKVRQ